MEILEETRERVLWLTINRPEVRNALSPTAMEALRAAFERAGRDPETRVIVLAGAGCNAVSSGADLRPGGTGVFADRTSLAAHEERGRLPDLLRAMHACPRPIIGKVQGYCLAGGVGVALACQGGAVAADRKVRPGPVPRAALGVNVGDAVRIVELCPPANAPTSVPAK